MRSRMRFLRVSLVTLLAFLTCAVRAATIDFDTLTDGVSVTNQYGGVTFTSATVATAGLSLNEFDFPPYSGSNVVFDDGGPIHLTFTSPVSSFSVRVTYTTPVTLSAYSANLALVGTTTSLYGNNTLLSGAPGSMANELLAFAYPNGIKDIFLSGSAGGSSFAADDVTFVAVVPEPTNAQWFVVALLGAGLYLGRRFLVRCVNKAAFVVLAVTAVLSIASSSYAIQTIDKPQADNDVIVIGSPVTLTISAQVSVDGALLPQSVNLVRLNSRGQRVSVLGRLYDDGTHGDALRGDGQFTAAFTFNETVAGPFSVAATAAYKGSVQRSQSPVLALTVVRRPTDAEIQTFVDVTNDGTAYFEQRRSQVGNAQAVIDLVSYLRAKPSVARVTVTPDGLAIWIKFTSGLESGISANPPGTKGTKAVGAASRASVPAQMPRFVRDQPVVEPTDNSRGIVLSPFAASFVGDETNAMVSDLNNFCGGSPTVYRDATADVSAFQQMSNYGVVGISSHGNIYTNGDVVILTGETVSFLSTLRHLGDWLTNRIRNVSGYWAITPAFVQAYAGSGYPKSIVYASACKSRINGTMSQAFTGSGVKTYFGYTDTVSVSFAASKGTALFDKLTDNMLPPEDRTTQKAYEAAGPLYVDPNPPHAVFVKDGSDITHIPGELVANGGFERGTFFGWTAGATPGYVRPVTEDHTAGSYAARIGRWDQPYSFFGGLNGPSVPGAEPFGTDSLYQDVQLPMEGTLTFKCKYNVVTYDGAAYDWLDIIIRDANTNAILNQPVTREGGIIQGSIFNWGLYYTTGWRDVQVDLTPYRGQKVRLEFDVRQDGYGDQIAAYIDEVSIACTH